MITKLSSKEKLPYAWFNFWSDSEKKELEKRFSDSKPFESIQLGPHLPPYYGTKDWANFVLKLGIAEANNKGRVDFARLQEIHYWIRVLIEEGWVWQAKRLQNHLNLAFKRGRFTVSAETEPPEGGGAPHIVVAEEAT